MKGGGGGFHILFNLAKRNVASAINLKYPIVVIVMLYHHSTVKFLLQNQHQPKILSNIFKF